MDIISLNMADYQNKIFIYNEIIIKKNIFLKIK